MSTKPPTRRWPIPIRINRIKLIKRSTPMARAASPIPSRSVARLGTLLIIALVAIGALVILFSTWRTIEPGYVGIVFDKASHQVTNTLDPGWVFINPLTESITRYPVGVQTLVMVQA